MNLHGFTWIEVAQSITTTFLLLGTTVWRLSVLHVMSSFSGASLLRLRVLPRSFGSLKMSILIQHPISATLPVTRGVLQSCILLSKVSGQPGRPSPVLLLTCITTSTIELLTIFAGLDAIQHHSMEVLQTWWWLSMTSKATPTTRGLQHSGRWSHRLFSTEWQSATFTSLCMCCWWYTHNRLLPSRKKEEETRSRNRSDRKWWSDWEWRRREWREGGRGRGLNISNYLHQLCI